MNTADATLRNLTDPRFRDLDEEVFQADAAGGGKLVRRREVTLDGTDATLETTADGSDVRLTFHRHDANIEATLGALDLPADWEPYGMLSMDVTNGPAAVDIELIVLCSRCRLIGRATLPAGQRQTVNVDLTELPLGAGNRALYEPSGLRIRGLHDAAHPAVVEIHAMSLTGQRDTDEPLIDRFGQRIRADWPGKVVDEEDLRDRAHTETKTLESTPDLPGRDEYGGLLDGPTFDATGFFRVDQDDRGVWWLVTPAGNAFWSVGVTGIRIDANEFTGVAGREHVYAELPPTDEPLARASQPARLHMRPDTTDLASFYAWNILRKYGSETAWADRVLQRLPKWGINTIGSFTQNPLYIEQRQIPHCRIARTRAREEGVHARAGKRFADVFDPRWEPWLSGVISELTAPCLDNPWLIGYFVDNEASWRTPRLLQADHDAPLRRRWVEFLREKLETLQRVNDAFAILAESWDDVAQMSDEQVPDDGPARELMIEFETLFADTYFGTVNRLLKQHDPNHLYLGCRFVKTPPPDHILRACGRHVDVCSVNNYTYPVPTDYFQTYHDLTGRPILIGEFHFPLASPRQLPPLYRCYTAEQREKMAEGYFRSFAEMPFALGCHWFQHVDQPLMGRASNGENQPIGLLDITDTPHEHLIRAFRRVGEHWPEWHGGAE
ncbi:MAG: hypothetical protein ACLFTN_04025 [Phycisphaerae bacterium]